MKKQIILIVATTLMLTACNNDTKLVSGDYSYKTSGSVAIEQTNNVSSAIGPRALTSWRDSLALLLDSADLALLDSLNLDLDSIDLPTLDSLDIDLPDDIDWPDDIDLPDNIELPDTDDHSTSDDSLAASYKLDDEIGQLTIIDLKSEDKDSVLLVLNEMDGSVTVVHAQVKDKKITLVPYTKNISIANLGEAEITVSGYGEYYDNNTIIIHEYYEGTLSDRLNITLTSDNITLVAKRN